MTLKDFIEPVYPSISELQKRLPDGMTCCLHSIQAKGVGEKAVIGVFVGDELICNSVVMAELLKNLKYVMGERWMLIHVPLHDFPLSW